MDWDDFPCTWLGEIFSNLDFVKQCLLLRVCRRWNTLLRSSQLLRSLILPIAPNIKFSDHHDHHHEKLKAIIARIAPSVRLVLVTHSGHAFPHHIHGYNFAAVSVVIVLLLADHSGPPNRRLVFRNLQYCCVSAHLFPFIQANPKPISYQCELHNVIVPAETAMFYLGFSVDRNCGFGFFTYAGSYASRLLYREIAPELETCINGTFIGPATAVGQENMDSVSYYQAFQKTILANIQPLDVAQLEEVRDRLRCCQMDGSVQQNRKWLNRILMSYQPTFNIRPDQDLSTLDYSQFSPVIQRLLLCTIVNVYPSKFDRHF